MTYSPGLGMVLKLQIYKMRTWRRRLEFDREHKFHLKLEDDLIPMFTSQASNVTNRESAEPSFELRFISKR